MKEILHMEFRGRAWMSKPQLLSLKIMDDGIRPHGSAGCRSEDLSSIEKRANGKKQVISAKRSWWIPDSFDKIGVPP
jgi:hypothetical protein